MMAAGDCNPPARRTGPSLPPFLSLLTVRAGTVRPLIGANTMRSILVLGLLMTLCVSANAATLHHHRTRHHVVIPPGVASSFAAVPGWTYAPVSPAVRYDDTPSYNDPSKSGGEA